MLLGASAGCLRRLAGRRLDWVNRRVVEAIPVGKALALTQPSLPPARPSKEPIAFSVKCRVCVLCLWEDLVPPPPPVVPPPQKALPAHLLLSPEEPPLLPFLSCPAMKCISSAQSALLSTVCGVWQLRLAAEDRAPLLSLLPCLLHQLSCWLFPGQAQQATLSKQGSAILLCLLHTA